MTKRPKQVLHRFILLVGLALLALGASAQEMQHVIVKTTGSRSALKQTIQAMGGHIDIEYQNVPAVAATVPARGALALRAVTDFKIIKDVQITLPKPPSLRGRPAMAQVDETGAQVVDFSDAIGKAPGSPADFAFNNTIIRANVLQNAGDLGQGVVVGVIDSGVANNPAVVQSLNGSVIGGESFVPKDPVKSATSTKNGFHGTLVGSMIAGHAIFFFSKAGCTGPSVQFNSPNSVIDGALFNLPGTLGVPMIGVAPAAKLYAFKVFSSAGGGTPTSVVIAAMDRALTIKKNFLAGKPSVPVSGSGTENDPFVFDSLNLQVLNLSLGGPEIFAGRGMDDIISNELTNAGIVVSIAAGQLRAVGSLDWVSGQRPERADHGLHTHSNP
jgi:subtilisin family serine protease